MPQTDELARAREYVASSMHDRDKSWGDLVRTGERDDCPEMRMVLKAMRSELALRSDRDPAEAEIEMLRDALTDFCAAAEYWAGCDEGCAPDTASSEIMRSGGCWPAQSYDKARALLARQHEIAHLVADGLSNKQIARKVGISHYTVKNHVHAVLRKFDVTRRAALGRAIAFGTGALSASPTEPLRVSSPAGVTITYRGGRHG